MSDIHLVNKAADNIRILSASMVEKAKSGHPGGAMGGADFINILYPNASVQIYNEWGQLLFESEGYATPWDGTYKGEPVPDGSYFYVIHLNADVSPDLYKGVITVLRKRG